MDSSDVLVGVLALLGGAVGAWLSFRAALRSTAQQERAGRREEWGRRFTAALDMVADPGTRRQVMGHALLQQLVRSELASDEEKRLAEAMVYASSRAGRHADLLTLVGPLPASVDEMDELMDDETVDALVVVEDDEEDEGGTA